MKNLFSYIIPIILIAINFNCALPCDDEDEKRDQKEAFLQKKTL
ncbi:hypothetical protein [Flavobacterium sp.]